MTATATYTKLKTGAWGVKLQGFATIPGRVSVTKRDGSVKTEQIERVLWQGDGVAIASICDTGRSAPARSGYGGSGYAPVRGCGACRQLGRMCRQCKFDEYDN